MSNSDSIQLLRSRSGEISVSVGGRLLYSRYSPSREVHRFVQEVLGHTSKSSEPPISPRTPIVIVSDGLGYLEKAVREIAPAAPVFSIHLSSTLSSESDVDLEHICCPDTGCDPGAFLAERIDAEALRLVKVIEWQPACNAFASVYARSAARIRSALRRAAGHSATVARWGKLWVRNILRNAGRYRLSDGLPHFGSRPALVVCSGPSLREILPTLSDGSVLPVVIAVSSALETLRYYGIDPDIVVRTDAGFFSSLHIPRNSRYHTRLYSNNVHIAPLTAAPLPGSSADGSLRVISGNSVCEKVATDVLGLRATVVPEAGTVSATATRLAALVTRGPRFIAGLDLASKDLEHHSRPHSFDTYFSINASRTHPALSMRFSRSVGMYRSIEGWQRADNLDLYAEWFREHSAEFTDTFRLSPSPVDIGIPPAEAKDLREGLNAWLSQSSGEGGGSTGDAVTTTEDGGSTGDAVTTTEDGGSTGDAVTTTEDGASMPIEDHATAHSDGTMRAARRKILNGWREEIQRSGNSGTLAGELSEWLGCERKADAVLRALREFGEDRERA